MTNVAVPKDFLPLAVDDKPRSAPIGWRWERLTNIARLESGHTPSRQHSEWWDGNVPWIALSDIRKVDGKEILETAETTNELGLKNSAARVLPKEKVVMSRTASVGFVTIMGRPMATSQDFVNWVCGVQIRPRFLMYLLIAARDYLLSLASGAVHKTIYVPTVESFRVCFPPTEIQDAIVHRLQNLIRSQQSAHDATKQATYSIAVLWRNILATIFSPSVYKTEELKPIGTIAQIVSGVGFPPKFQGRRDLRIPFIKVSDFQEARFRIAITCSAKNTIDAAIGAQLGAHVCPPGTIIFPKVGGALLTEKKTLIGRESAFDNNIMGLIPTACEPEWLYYYMLTIELGRLSNQQAMPSINQRALRTLSVPMPQKELRQRIIGRLKEISEILERGQKLIIKQTLELHSLRSSLLRAAFSGQL